MRAGIHYQKPHPSLLAESRYILSLSYPKADRIEEELYIVCERLDSAPTSITLSERQNREKLIKKEIRDGSDQWEQGKILAQEVYTLVTHYIPIGTFVGNLNLNIMQSLSPSDPLRAQITALFEKMHALEIQTASPSPGGY